MRAIQISRFGGPEVLEPVELAIPEPAVGEILIEVSHAGVNFADMHSRTGSYVGQASLPLVPGGEVAGRRMDTGERVVALTGGTGGYAQYATAPAAHAWPIPDGVEDGTALALVIQGTTAWHLYRTAARVGPGMGGGEGGGQAGRQAGRVGVDESQGAGVDVGNAAGESVVVHSAAGGVGSLAVQLGHALGAGRVIGTASSSGRRELVLALGADAAIDPAPEGLTERLIEANDGRPVDVVFDMAGGATFDASYAALAHFGRIVVCGISGERPNEVRTGSLLRHSRAVAGFYLFHCLEAGRTTMFADALADLFARVGRGELHAIIGGVYPLGEAARAHVDLRERRTTGKLLLDPAV